jgi:hypothetical protein
MCRALGARSFEGMSKHTKATATFLVLAAVAAPTAQARPVESLLPDTVNQAEGGNSVATTSAGGFDWTDAGVGAAGMLALMGLGTGAVVASRRRLLAPGRG